MALPEHERAKIAARLVESLDEATQSDVDEAWAAEIEQRCAACRRAIGKEVRARSEREIFGR